MSLLILRGVTSAPGLWASQSLVQPVVPSVVNLPACWRDKGHPQGGRSHETVCRSWRPSCVPALSAGARTNRGPQSMPTLQHANGALGCALTPREHQITSLVSAGFSNKERITHKEMKP